MSEPHVFQFPEGDKEMSELSLWDFLAKGRCAACGQEMVFQVTLGQAEIVIHGLSHEEKKEQPS